MIMIAKNVAGAFRSRWKASRYRRGGIGVPRAIRRRGAVLPRRGPRRARAQSIRRSADVQQGTGITGIGIMIGQPSVGRWDSYPIWPLLANLACLRKLVLILGICRRRGRFGGPCKAPSWVGTTCERTPRGGGDVPCGRRRAKGRPVDGWERSSRHVRNITLFDSLCPQRGSSVQ